MTRRLLLLRHAKSSWDDAAIADFDRPLAARGKEAAPRMGRLIAARDWRIDRALVSPAARTRATWALVAAELADPPAATFPETLYPGAPAALLGQLRALPQGARTALVIGHNPGLEDLAASLAGPESDADAVARMREKFPTAALAVFEARTEWSGLGPDGGRLVEFRRPQELS